MAHSPGSASPIVPLTAAEPGVGLVPDVSARAATATGHANAVRRMFDRISPTYDLLNRLLSFGIDRRWRTHALDELARDLPEGPLVDLCAGTLDLSAAMHARFPGRSLFSLDFARDMLVAGRSKAASAKLVVADAMRLPLRSGSVAGMVCGFGMRNLAEPSAGMREVARVLAPGGVFIVLEFFRPTRLPTRVFHAVYARVVLPTLGRIISGDAEAYRYLSRSMQGFLSREEFAGALRDAGFEKVQAFDLTLGIASVVRGVRPHGALTLSPGAAPAPRGAP